MIKYQEIQRRLLEIEGGLFQNLCNAILYATEDDCNHIFEPGSQVGTTKTTVGTPDTYYILPDGQYVLVEYTTESPNKVKNVIKKFKIDIDKCTDREKTGLHVDEIDKIICCCTADFSVKDRKAIVEYGSEKGIRVEIKGIHSIARQLAGPCANIAKDYLGIAIETHQVLTPKVFAQEYEASGLSTPLSNVFLHRTNELADLLNSIKSEKQVSILTGPAGMGKSRLAMEAFEQVVKLAPETLCFCITNKNAYLHDDLRTYLSKDAPYLFLVDDANRQTGHLKSLLSILKEAKSKKIHVVITVRDYALVDVQKECEGYKNDVIKVGKFTDGELADILRSEDFQVNGAALERILEISNGNARLAIMAAKVYGSSNDLSALDDVATLYDSYFENAIGEGNVLSDIDVLRSIGLLSFFFSIDFENKDFISNLCSRFEIGESKFRSAMLELEKLELAESNEDLSIMKISDQVLGTYFFYRTFVRDGILSFRTIMEHYRGTHLVRIRDSVIPANNTFSYDKVYPKIDPVLSEYWGQIMQDEQQAFGFLDLFWQYRKNDLFAFVKSKIDRSAMETSKNTKFTLDSSSERFGYGRDQYLALLDNFFPVPGRDCETATVLSLSYVSAFPQWYSQLAETFKTEFAISLDDRQTNFSRQLKFWERIVNGVYRADALSIALFFDIAQEMMKTGTRVVRRHGNKYNVSKDEAKTGTNGYYAMREMTWKVVDNHFGVFREEIIGFMLAFIQTNLHSGQHVYYFDFNNLVNLFDGKFDPSSFVHCYLVRELLRMIEKEKIEDTRISSLKAKFDCVSYQCYIVLSSDRLRDKDMYDYEFTDHDKYRKIKDLEIRNRFNLKTLSEFQEFYKCVLEIYSFKATYANGILYSVNIVLLQVLENRPKVSLEILAYLIETDNATKIVPYHVFGSMWKSSGFAEDLFDLIYNSNFSSRTSWIQTYIDQSPEEKLTIQHLSAYVDLIRSTETQLYIYWQTLERLSTVDQQIFSEVLNALTCRIPTKVEIMLDDNIFSAHLYCFKDIKKVEKVYLMQSEIQKHFDYQYKGLLEIVKLDGAFLMEYIRTLPVGYDGLSRTEYYELHAIWQLPDAEQHIIEIIDYLAEARSYSLSDDGLNIFFSGLEPQFVERAKILLINYLKSNCKDRVKVDLVLKVARNSLKDIEAEVIVTWLLLNPCFDDFKDLSLQNSLLSGGGGTVFNEIRAARYEKVLKIFDELPADNLDYLEHKLYLEEKIAIYYRAAIRERRRNFLYGE